MSTYERKRMVGVLSIGDTTYPLPGKSDTKATASDDVALKKSLGWIEYKEVPHSWLSSETTELVKSAVRQLAAVLGVPEPSIHYYDDWDFIDEAERAIGAKVRTFWTAPTAVGAFEPHKDQIWLKYGRSYGELLRTVAHEMCHVWQHANYGPMKESDREWWEQQAQQSVDNALTAIGYPWSWDEQTASAVAR